MNCVKKPTKPLLNWTDKSVNPFRFYLSLSSASFRDSHADHEKILYS